MGARIRHLYNNLVWMRHKLKHCVARNSTLRSITCNNSSSSHTATGIPNAGVGWGSGSGITCRTRKKTISIIKMKQNSVILENENARVRAMSGDAKGETGVLGNPDTNCNKSSNDNTKSLTGDVVLNETERKIFDTLLQTCRFHGLNTTLRVAGGWVRDKVLGRESDDIDIALDDHMGHPFATKVHEYLTATNHANTNDSFQKNNAIEKNQDISELYSSVGMIKSNPEQSKHLETATMRLCGQWIDFVNLRTESYANGNDNDDASIGSRIPSSAFFGSPSEDSYRRDLTINSLFYNIHNGCVEDYTGMGLADLRDGIIRTPMEIFHLQNDSIGNKNYHGSDDNDAFSLSVKGAKQTFLDDPLRVLRSVRFAARFQFELSGALEAAMQDEAVAKALDMKVSRERIGSELDGMIKGPHPGRAIRLLERNNVLPVMFGIDRFAEVSAKITNGGSHIDYHEITSRGESAVRWLAFLNNSFHKSHASSPPSFKVTDECRRAAYLSALLLGTREYSYKGGAKSHNNKVLPLSQGIILDSFKLSKRDAETIVAVHESLPDMLKLLCKVTNKSLPQLYSDPYDSICKEDDNGFNEMDISLSQGFARRRVGMLIRKLKENWIVSLLVCPLLSISDDQASFDSEDPVDRYSIDKEKAIEAWSVAILEFYLAVESSGIADAWQIKPLLSGKELMSSFGMTKGGPILGKATTRLMEWQLENPRAARDECERWLRTSLREELNI